jgi:galactose-1-phosphate uridylyltransferase
MSNRLARTKLRDILECENLDRLSLEQISELIQTEEEISKFIPEGTCRIDPRNGDPILHNTARARRPHDGSASRPAYKKQNTKNCVICQGKTTGVFDVAELSEGFTFINKNLYPILYPHTVDSDPSSARAGLHEDPATEDLNTNGASARGLHLLQWTSSVHDRDWHNLPGPDRFVVMERLAVLEGKLLSVPPTLPRGTGSESRERSPHQQEKSFVSVIKNYGPLVGGSLDHGHQQIALSNVMPRRFLDNLRFEQQRDEPFTSFILRENPSELLIRDYESAVLIVPYFMRIPYDLLLVIKDPRKHHLHELNHQEIQDIADGWHDAIQSIMRIMAGIGRPTVYNVITNNGPAGGLYFDFLPYTQAIGGMEQLGLFVCEQDPVTAAALIREAIGEEAKET